jgi:hypothetical protein
MDGPCFLLDLPLLDRQVSILSGKRLLVTLLGINMLTFRRTHIQDYMRSIVNEADPDALQRAGVKLIIIGSGSPSLARAYRRSYFSLSTFLSVNLLALPFSQ